MAKSLLTGIPPTHPGEILREDVFPALGRSKVEIAKLLGVSRRALYNLLGEKTPITPPMALRIGKLTGTSPESWLRLQQTYDLRVAEKAIGKKVAKIPTLKAA